MLNGLRDVDGIDISMPRLIASPFGRFIEFGSTISSIRRPDLLLGRKGLGYS